MKCAICGNPLEKDLFASVTSGKVCAICTVYYIGGLPETTARINTVREKLGLKDGEYIQQDNGKEAARILGRKTQ